MTATDAALDLMATWPAEAYRMREAAVQMWRKRDEEFEREYHAGKLDLPLLREMENAAVILQERGHQLFEKVNQ